MVREIADACRRHGLAFGVYLSPWDRNHPEYGRPAYLEYYRGQLRELMTGYGPLFEVWFDGANGGDGYYGGARERRTIDRRTYYDWPNTWQIVRDLQPDAVMFSDAGPDVRWVGNEKGIAGDPCWATLDRDDFAPGEADEARLNRGRPAGDALAARRVRRVDPARLVLPRGARTTEVKTPARPPRPLLPVGGPRRVAPPQPAAGPARPDPRERRALAARLPAAARRHVRRRSRARRASQRQQRAGRRRPVRARRTSWTGERDTYWTTDDAVTTPELVLDLGRPVTFNVVSLREHLPLGQRVEDWALDAWQDGAWREFAKGTAIGNRRLWRGEDVTTTRVRLRITKAPVCPAISELALHLEPPEARPRG